MIGEQGSEDNEMPRGVWKAVETKAGEARMAETEGGGKERESRKEAKKKKRKEKGKEKDRGIKISKRVRALEGGRRSNKVRGIGKKVGSRKVL